jgi:hypothetical protein
MALAVLAACGDQAPVQPSDPVIVPPPVVTVSLEIVPDTMAPGNAAVVDAHASSSSPNFDEFELTLAGLIEGSLPLTLRPGREQHATLTLTIPPVPIEGTIDVTVHARVMKTRDSATAELTIHDDEPPTIVIAESDYQYDFAAHRVLLAAFAEDNSALAGITLEVSGAITHRETIALDAAPEWMGEIPVFPSSMNIGDTSHVRWSAVDIFGRQTTVGGIVVAGDIERPRIEVGVDTITGGPFYWGTLEPLAHGDTAHVAVVVRDNHQLAWWGLQFGDDSTMRDSFPTLNTTEYVTIVPITQDTDPPPPTSQVTFFVRDSVGNIRTREWGFNFFDGPRPPAVLIEPNASVGGAQGAVYAPNHHRVYLGEESGTIIHALDLNTLTYTTVANLPYPLHAFDLTVSDDSLIVAFGRTPYLGIVDLTTTPATVDTLRLEGVGSQMVWSVSVDHLNKSITSLTSEPGSPYVGAHVFDFNSQQHGVQPGVGTHTDIVRSTDRSTMILWNPRGRGSQLYNPATGTVVNLPHSGRPTMDSAGTRAIFGATLYEVDRFGLVPLLDFDGVLPVTLTPNGDFIYTRHGSVEFAYQVIDVGSGAVVERGILPWFPSRFMLLPAGNEMLLFSGRAPSALIDLR